MEKKRVDAVDGVGEEQAPREVILSENKQLLLSLLYDMSSAELELLFNHVAISLQTQPRR